MPELKANPRAFLVAQTALNFDELFSSLSEMGVTEFNNLDLCDGEALVEVMGRLCYRSFQVGLNPNVTRIRDDSNEYIQNIIAQKHGSVLEHVQVSFIITGVSRILTHELVRHRSGVAISQESMRYVRLTDGVQFPIPSVIEKNPDAASWAFEKIQIMQDWQQELSSLLGVEEMTSFAEKKEATSAMRRFMGDGVATRIGWSANIRALRHVIEMRTSPSAEEEIRIVFDEVAMKCRNAYPNFFADFTREDNGAWVPKYSKV